MMGRTLLMMLVLLSQPGSVTAAATLSGANWLASERSYLSEQWSDYRQRKEIRKFAFRICRERATNERIAPNLRAEFVHRCVRERRDGETAGRL